MVVASLSESACYALLDPSVAEGLRFLRETDLLALSLGEHTIGNGGVFAIVSEYDTKPLSEGAFEAHRKYIDIQCIVSGCEQIGYAPLADVSPTSEYDPAKDLQWFAGEPSLILMKAGMFMVLHPDDAHMPCIAVGSPGPVRKVVVKAPTN